MNYVSREVPLEEIFDSECRVLYEYWDNLRGERFAPSWQDFDLPSLSRGISANLRVVDVLDDGADFFYRYWGTGMVSMCKSEQSGKRLSEIPGPRTAELFVEYRTVFNSREPLAIIHDARWADEHIDLIAPAIRLPLSSDGETVDKVLTFTDPRGREKEWSALFEAAVD